MTKLIALVDGSIYSQSVCDHAAWMANRTSSSVNILHILGRRDTSTEPANLSGNIGLGARTALLEELADLDAQKAKLAQQRGRAILEDAHTRVANNGIADVTTKLRNGEIVETVQEFENDADVIVIGKRGEAADFDKLHLGSNLERVVRSNRKPVFVASRVFKPIKRLLIAFDGGESAKKAVSYIASNKAFEGFHCALLMIGTPTNSSAEQVKNAEAVLRDANYSVEADIKIGQPETVIAKKIDTDNFDLLVMGAYGHSRIRNLIIGSTTTEMIRSCLVPVMLFR